MEQGKSRLAQEFEKKEEGRLVRLNKYISEAGLCSRREADRLIEAGQCPGGWKNSSVRSEGF